MIKVVQYQLFSQPFTFPNEDFLSPFHKHIVWYFIYQIGVLLIQRENYEYSTKHLKSVQK